MKYCIRRGYDIPIKGVPEASLKDLREKRPRYFSVRPTEFHYIKPKLQVQQGDDVKVGSPLFFDKRHEVLSFASPVSGRVHKIRFGPRRCIEAIIIEASSGEEEYQQWPSFRPDEISIAKKEDLKKILLEAGLWPHIRQRPFDIIADPDRDPDAIFINCMDTAPLSADPEFTLKDRLVDLRAGLEALGLFSKKLHLVLNGKVQDSIFQEISIRGSELKIHRFVGAHPAGLVSTHIQKISPLHAKKVIWYLNARDAADLGTFLLLGRYPTERIVALSGMGVAEKKERCYYKIRIGASLEGFLKHKLLEGEQRILSGNLLTGKKIGKEDSLGFYDDVITVIPESWERHFIGWMLPGLSRPSWSRAFFSALLPWRKYNMNTNKNGELRSLVKTGDYEKVIALDILPSFLLKAILCEDIELMEQLGIYELAPEDFALCSYICPSKVEFCQIVRSGLDMMLAELS